MQVTATTGDGDSQWSLPGAGATLDLALSVSSEQDAVTEGEVAVFIVTLSQETPVKFDIEYAWVGDFGKTTLQTVQVLDGTMWRLHVPTIVGSTDQNGSVTATIRSMNACCQGRRKTVPLGCR